MLSLKYSIRCFQQMLHESHSTQISYSKVPNLKYKKERETFKAKYVLQFSTLLQWIGPNNAGECREHLPAVHTP